MMMINANVQRRIILVASLEFLLATMGLLQIHLSNATYETLRVLTVLLFGATACYGLMAFFKPELLGGETDVPILKSPARELVRIGVSLVTLPVIFYVGYGEFLVAVDSQYVSAYTKRVFEYAALKRKYESEEAARKFVDRAATAQGRLAEKLELQQRWSISHYQTYVDLMSEYTEDPYFGLGIMARIYDKCGDTEKAEDLYYQNHYRYHVSTPQTPDRFALLEARLLDVLRYIPEKEAMAKIWWMPSVIADKNASALRLGRTWVSFDFRSNIYDLRGLDGPIGYEEKHDFPILCKNDVEWLLAGIGKKRVVESIPQLAPLCPDWQVSDYVFEYGVIPPIAYGARRLPDVFRNKNKENKAPFAWRVPRSLAASLPHEEVIMPVALCKKLFVLAGDPDGYRRRIDEGHIYFNAEQVSFDEAKRSEQAFYKKVIRLK